MNTEWSLEVLYKGYQDEKFTNDLKKLKNLIKEIKEFVPSLSQSEPLSSVSAAITYWENYKLLLSRLGEYVSLRQSTNTTDSETASYLGKIKEADSALAKEFSIIKRYFAGLDNLEAIINADEKLKNYWFFFRHIKEEAPYTLSEEVEEVIAKLNLSAGSAWATLQQYLTSTLEVDFNGEKTTLSAIRNLAYSDNSATRKAAYLAELSSYSKIKDSIAFSLNSLKAQVNTICDLRGYESPLAMTLIDSRMKKETLEAMFTAIKEYLPKFHLYLRRKAQILGYENGLPWYELFAPLGEYSKSYTLEEAKEYLLNHFAGFADDLADMIREAFDNSWIDFYPHPGKVGGAFCSNLPFVRESRILTNYDGTLSDIVTLAHELGHAYHGLQIEDHLPLNTDYTMPVAETASTFNETVIMNAAIKEANEKEKIVLLESQLQDTTQIICDIYSRFLFESAVFEKRREAFMFSDELEQMMLSAQKKAYGDGLDPEFMHPFMWVNKSHYYSENLSFYNFPYAFGGLFARGLYAKYQEEGPAFVKKYRALLHATTVNTVEEVALMADIDLTRPDFWRQSLKTIADSIDLFLELTDKA